MRTRRAGSAILSVGLQLPIDGDLPLVPRGATIVVGGGDTIGDRPNLALIRWLQKSARMGARLAGLHSASLTLARAGLLTSRRATIHWQYQDCLIEHFPEIEVKQSTYTSGLNV